jgi:hypothetical protein
MFRLPTIFLHFLLMSLVLDGAIFNPPQGDPGFNCCSMQHAAGTAEVLVTAWLQPFPAPPPLRLQGGTRPRASILWGQSGQGPVGAAEARREWGMSGNGTAMAEGPSVLNSKRWPRMGDIGTTGGPLPSPGQPEFFLQEVRARSR